MESTNQIRRNSGYPFGPHEQFPDLGSTKGLVQIPKNINKIHPFPDGHQCCEHLDDYCQDVEIGPDRKITVCYIPGSKKLSLTWLKKSKCYESYEKSSKIATTKTGPEATTKYSVNLGTEDSPSSERKAKNDENNYFSNTSQSIINETAVYMIHGVGGEFKVWSPQIIFLNSYGFTIIAINLIGHGRSSTPLNEEAYTFEKMSNDVFTVFDFFKMPRNIVMGHSYGCCFAALLARRRPNYVNALVMIGGGGPIPLGPQLGVFCLPLCCLHCFKWFLYREFLSRSFYKPNRANACQLTAINVPVHVLKHTLNGQKWDEGGIDFYSWISSPTLLIHGRQDRLISIGEVRLMEDIIPGASLAVLDDVGHMVMLESPNEVNNLVANLIDNNLRR